MSRLTILALGLSLMLPATAAFADGEGTWEPTVFASPASGVVHDRGIPAFDYEQGDAPQLPVHPAFGDTGMRRGPAVPQAEFMVNPGLTQ